MADCDTCGCNIAGKCRAPGGENMFMDEIDMDADCDEWCDKESKEHEKAQAEYNAKFPIPARDELLKAVGSNSFKMVEYLLGPAATLMANSEDRDIQNTAINNAKTILSAINPCNELESMLAAQMVGIHDLAMKKMVSCASDDWLDAVNLKVNQVTKLSRTFIAQLEALNKLRGKGQQKITVEYVTINDGGQAIVGNIEQGGRGENKK